MTEDLLREAMDRFTDDVSVPPGLRDRAARRLRGRRRLRVASAAAAVAAATGLGVTLAAAPRPAPMPDVHTAAYVIGRTQAALSRQQYVEHARVMTSAKLKLEIAPGGLSRTMDDWRYQQDVRMVTYGTDGRVNADVAIALAGADRGVTVVDYQHHTWWRLGHTPPAAPAEPPVPASGCQAASLVGIEFLGGNTDWATRIRTALSCGQYQIAGTQRVDGVQAIHLTAARTRPGSTVTDFWVDPHTYLPVRDVASFGRGGSARVDLQWLAPGKASLAQLRAHVPPGFSLISPPSYNDFAGLLIFKQS